MPTRVELDYFLANAAAIPHPDRDATLTRLHRVTAPHTPFPEVYAFAFDHRPQFFDLAREVGADEARIPLLKQLLVDAVAKVERDEKLQGRVGVLIDDVYGSGALAAATGRGWWIARPVELPGSRPLVFQHGRSVGTTLASWPAEHIAKCLVAVHPDGPVELRLEQETQLKTLYDACQASGHELLIELIPPAMPALQADTVPRAIKRLYNLGIIPEWWKLAPMVATQWAAVDALIAERDPYCRGVVLLGQSAPVTQLMQGFAEAKGIRSVRGFAVGRTLFAEPSLDWLAGRIDDAQLVEQAAANFATLIGEWQKARA
jgi:5-dehydro-2-deoxygluconokinase